MCMRAVKVLVRLGRCACLPELLLFSDAISAKVSCSGLNMYHPDIFEPAHVIVEFIT